MDSASSLLNGTVASQVVSRITRQTVTNCWTL